MNNIIEKVAKNYNCTPIEVEKEIAFAVSEAKKDGTHKSKTFWASIPNEFLEEDIILILSNEVLNRILHI